MNSKLSAALLLRGLWAIFKTRPLEYIPLRPGTLTRYIFSSWFIPWSLFFLCCTLLAGLGATLCHQYRHPILVLAPTLKLLPAYLALAIPFTLPLSILLATILCYHGLAQDGELITLRLLGIPLRRFVLPLAMLVGVAGTLCMHAIQGYMAPPCRYQVRVSAREGLADSTLLPRLLSQQELALGGLTVTGFPAENGEIAAVDLVLRMGDGRWNFYTAKSILPVLSLNRHQLQIFKGTAVEIDARTRKVGESFRFEGFKVPFPADLRPDGRLKNRDVRELTDSELAKKPEMIQIGGADIRKREEDAGRFRTERLRRWNRSLGAVIAFLAGLSLGLRGASIRMIPAVILGLVLFLGIYFPALLLAESAAWSAISSWSVTGVAGAAALLDCWRKEAL